MKRTSDRNMPFAFTEEDLQRIGAVLGAHVKREGALTRYELLDEDSGRRLAVEIHSRLNLPDELSTDRPVNLVSVYGSNSFLQLQGCTGFVASEDLGEVIFFARRSGSLNGLVVERGAGSSLYANVDERLLSYDFTQLPAELMMGTVALSMTETMFDDLPDA